MSREVLDALDHRFLNKEVPEFFTKIPTTENLAIVIWQRLAPKLNAAQLHRVRVYETPDLFVDFTEKHESAPHPPLHVFRVAPLAQRRNVGGENRATYGKCNNPYGHGHNYMLEVTVSGPVDDQTGMVCNLVDLDGFVRTKSRPLRPSEFEPAAEFAKQVPTTENLCIAIYEIVKRGFGKAHLEKVRIEETMMNSFEYSGEEGR
jgi:6-pyruvoyltetrahydropterin/6-carboxytetrahydropterin synthase